MQDQNQTPEASAHAEPAAPAPDTAPPTAEGRIKVLETQLAEAREDFLRAKAETENTRRRASEDIAKAHKFAVESFAEALVPVKDSLDAAALDTSGSVETLKNGVELTIKQLTAAFEKGRVTMIDPVWRSPWRKAGCSIVASSRSTLSAIPSIQTS